MWVLLVLHLAGGHLQVGFLGEFKSEYECSAALTERLYDLSGKFGIHEQLLCIKEAKPHNTLVF